MKEKFLSFVKKHKLIRDGDAVLVGFSGGKDSVFLLQMLLESREILGVSRIGALHVNHMLRGDESDKDRDFCRRWCAERDIEYYEENIRVKVLALRNRASLEETGREIRYKLLEAYRQKEGFHWSATAHNVDDQCETILFRLAKGTGLDGVMGIREKIGHTIRPMLDISADEIVEYLDRLGLKYRHDSSNKILSYDRNRIRHNIIPQLKKINPEVLAAFTRFRNIASYYMEVSEHYLSEMAARRTKLTEMGLELKTEGLSHGDIIMLSRYILKEEFSHISSYADMESVAGISNGESGKYIRLTDDLEVHNNFGALYFKAPEGFFQEYELRIEAGKSYLLKYGWRLETEIIRDFPFKLEEGTVLISLDDEGDEFFVRNRRRGDIFVPLSTGRRRKLKKYLNDRKIPRIIRDSLLMITGKDRIYAILGLEDSIHVNEPGHDRYLKVKYTRYTEV